MLNNISNILFPTFTILGIPILSTAINFLHIHIIGNLFQLYVFLNSQTRHTKSFLLYQYLHQASLKLQSTNSSVSSPPRRRYISPLYIHEVAYPPVKGTYGTKLEPYIGVILSLLLPLCRLLPAIISRRKEKTCLSLPLRIRIPTSPLEARIRHWPGRDQPAALFASSRENIYTYSMFRVSFGVYTRRIFVGITLLQIIWVLHVAGRRHVLFFLLCVFARLVYYTFVWWGIVGSYLAIYKNLISRLGVLLYGVQWHVCEYCSTELLHESLYSVNFYQ